MECNVKYCKYACMHACMHMCINMYIYIHIYLCVFSVYTMFCCMYGIPEKTVFMSIFPQNSRLQLLEASGRVAPFRPCQRLKLLSIGSGSCVELRTVLDRLGVEENVGMQVSGLGIHGLGL